MIIAVSYKDNEIFEHFGHAEYFAIYETNDDNTQLISKKIIACGGENNSKFCAYCGSPRP